MERTNISKVNQSHQKEENKSAQNGLIGRNLLVLSRVIDDIAEIQHQLMIMRQILMFECKSLLRSYFPTTGRRQRQS